MKTKTSKLEINEDVIRSHLPIPPFSHKYRVVQQSPQIWRVDLIHPSVYTYTTEQVYSVWGFVKGGMVYPPKNSTKPSRTPLCSLSEVTDELQYTTIRPTCSSLQHLN